MSYNKETKLLLNILWNIILLQSRIIINGLGSGDLSDSLGGDGKDANYDTHAQTRQPFF